MKPLERAIEFIKGQISASEAIKAHVKKVMPGKFRPSAYTDGSFSLYESRGVGVALLSASTVVMHDDKNVNIIDYGPDGLLIILVPKYKLGARAGNLMRFVEISSALGAADSVDTLFFDGSYLTLLLSPSAVDSIYRDFRDSFSDFSEFVKALKQILSVVGKYAEKTSEFPDIYYDALAEIFQISTEFPEGSRISGQNYAILLLEHTISMVKLAEFLERCKKEGKLAIWVAKDSESRILSRKFGGSMNDLVLTDLALRPGEYINVGSFIQLPPVTLDKVTVKAFCEKELKSGVVSLHPDTARRIYGKFSSYHLIYAKFSDYSIQISCPSSLCDPEDVVPLIASVSGKFGYPEPLIIAHHRCKLTARLSEAMAGSIYDVCRKIADEKVCEALRESGRRLIGL